MGTRSVLFGAHQFIWHPLTVCRAWKELYGTPTFKEVVCIFVHDIGYLGKKTIDGEDGKTHPELGAKIAKLLFGDVYYQLVLYHSRSYSKLDGQLPSKLCWADKLSIKYDNKRFYIWRTRLTGEMKEFRKNNECVVSELKSDSEWYEWLHNYFITEAKEANQPPTT